MKHIICIFLGWCVAVGVAADDVVSSPADRLEQLRGDLSRVSQAQVHLGGIDAIAALSTLADAVSDLNRRIPKFGPAGCTALPDGTSCLELQALIKTEDGSLVASMDLGPGGQICGPFVLRGLHNVAMLVIAAGECLPKEVK
jgi:hypothetical protein